jgi:hypothetical protein
VFRYQPSPVEENLPKPEDDSAEVADWFNTQTDPEIAQAVAAAVADARSSDISAITAAPPGHPQMQYPPLSQQEQQPAPQYQQPPYQQPQGPRHGDPQGR